MKLISYYISQEHEQYEQRERQKSWKYTFTNSVSYFKFEIFITMWRSLKTVHAEAFCMWNFVSFFK